MDVADSLLDLVGNTPLVRLGRVGRTLECDLLAKVEMFNPGGSPGAGCTIRKKSIFRDTARAISTGVPGGTAPVSRTSRSCRHT